MGGRLLKQVTTEREALTKEAGYETNDNIVLNLNSETTDNEPVEKTGDNDGNDNLVKTLKDENVIEDILIMSGTENLKDMSSEIEKELKDNIVVCDIAEETVLIVEVAESEIKKGGSVTTETSLKLVEQYNKLLGVIPNSKLKGLTIESGNKYPREVLDLTKESAESALEKLKALVIEIISKIVVKIRKMFITAVGLIDNIEKSSKRFEDTASSDYTDVVIERFEDHIPSTSIKGRMAIIEDITVDNIINFIKFTNRGADIGSLVKEFIEGIKRDEFETLKKLFFTTDDLSQKYSKLLKSNKAYDEYFKNTGNILPLRLSGTTAIVLCSDIVNASTNERKLSIKEFQIEVSKNVKERIARTRENKDSKELLTRANLISIAQELSKAGRGQRESIKKSLEYLDKIKIAVETIDESSKLKSELSKIVSVLTRAVFINTYSGTMSNRLVLLLLGEYIGLYEKQNQTKK